MQPTDKAIRAALVRWAKAEDRYDECTAITDRYFDLSDAVGEAKGRVLRLAQRLAAQESKR